MLQTQNWKPLISAPLISSPSFIYFPLIVSSSSLIYFSSSVILCAVICLILVLFLVLNICFDLLWRCFFTFFNFLSPYIFRFSIHTNTDANYVPLTSSCSPSSLILMHVPFNYLAKLRSHYTFHVCPCLHSISNSKQNSH